MTAPRGIGGEKIREQGLDMEVMRNISAERLENLVPGHG